MPAHDTLLLRQIEALYCDHHHWLKGWLRSRLGCSYQAADFAQDTFLRILAGSAAGGAVETIREPRSYLATVANRVVIDHFRRKKLEEAYLDALSRRPEAVAISPEERVILLETLQELDAMLHGLGAKVRRAFLLAQFHGMAYGKIASELEVSVSSVKKYMAKATEHCLLYALEAGL